MQRSKPRLTFRLKLLLALVGTIAPLLIITLLVVRQQADRQVEKMVAATMTRATEAFTRVERIRQQQLQQLSTRYTGSNRWGQAVQQAAQEGDTTFLIEQTRYELKLAALPNALAAFTDLDGRTLTAFARERQLADPAAAIPPGAIERLFAGDTAVYGYHVVGRDLYSIHPTVLYLGDFPTGVLFLGIPIDNEAAQSLAEALGTDVCFFAANRCIATSRVPIRAQLEHFGNAADRRQIQRVDMNGEPFALVRQELTTASAGTNIAIVLRIPLAPVIGPFQTIQDAIKLIGFIMLILAILVALRLSRGLAQPVRDLQKATARVAQGDYEATVHVRSRDELGQLAESFNAMTHGLLLKERYKGVLDKVVSRDVADEMLKGEIKLGGETREVTTLFADMRGFTALSQEMDPQQVVSLLNEVMEHAEAAVVEEGGVVDKYVGDQIMAIFGAPVARDDDAMRALRAAVRIHDATNAVNRSRQARGEPEIGMGVGVNTGMVVAGNMGSARRLNYTVLGGAVNLANRLCSEAASGQTLLSDATLQRVRGRVQTNALGTRHVKGFSEPVVVHELIAVEPALPSKVGAVAGALTMLLFSAVTAGAQQIQPSARLDLNLFAPSSDGAGLIKHVETFVAGRASLFIDAFAGQRLYGLLELRVDRGEAPSDEGVDARVEQAFLRFSASSKLHVQAGRFVSPFGNYPQRHHSVADPFIRPPLLYDYRTVASTRHIPSANDGFLNWKNAPAANRPIGSPAVWDAPYQIGAMLLGSFGPLNIRLAAMNSAPSSEPEAWEFDSDQLERPSFVAHAGFQIGPELRLGASYNRGSFLEEDMQPALPEAGELSDYTQQLIGLEATWMRGMFELRGEVIHDTWEIPRVTDDVIDISYYVESKLKVLTGGYVAARFGQMRFNEIARTAGPEEEWDYLATRWQFAAGYRFTQSLDARAEYMLNTTAGPIDPNDNLFALQLSWLIGR